MKTPTLAEAGRFILIVFGVLVICLIARILLFDGPRESIGAGDIVVAITAAVLIMGGWLSKSEQP